jgi:hypothetical protein
LKPIYRIIIMMYHSCFVRTIHVDQMTETYLTPHGILHIQPHFRSHQMKPHGGTIFIPYPDVVSVTVGTTPSYWVEVSQVDIVIKKKRNIGFHISHRRSEGYDNNQNNNDDLSNWIVNGYPTIVLHDKEEHFYQITIYGLVNPYNLQRAILEHVELP